MSGDTLPPGALGFSFPASSSLQDTQEFEIKRTMSGIVEKPKNRFSENKKWILTWEYLTQSQLAQLQSASADQFWFKDPLGRPCVGKTVDFRPFHMSSVTGPDGELLSGATVETLVVNANHNLYAPGWVPITTPANDMSRMPTLAAPGHTFGGNTHPFGPPLEPGPVPAEWNRSARLINATGNGQPAQLTSPLLTESTGCVYFAFQTSTA